MSSLLISRGLVYCPVFSRFLAQNPGPSGLFLQSRNACTVPLTAFRQCPHPSPYTGPGQHLWKAVHQLMKAVQQRHPDIRITLRWVPGHMDVEGNELADQHAKDAATGRSSDKTSLPKYLRKTLPRSAAKAKQMMKAQAKREAEEAWKKSPRYAKLNTIDNTLPSAKFLQLTADIPRKHAALLIQLRTGHAPLKKHLHRIKRATSSTCPACEMYPETVEHYLLRCPAFERARQALFIEAGRPARSITTLLNHPKLLKPLFRYIHSTHRFHAQLGHMHLPKPKTPKTPTTSKNKQPR